MAGNGIYAASQWALLSLVAKLGGREMLGEYALAVALTAPVAMLAHLNLRAVLATDVNRQHGFGDFLAVRFPVSALGLAAMAALALWFGRGAERSAVILLAGVAQTSETLSDAYYGAMQRRGEMDRIARSMMARGLLSAAALGVTLALTGSLAAAVAALAAGRLAVLVGFDARQGEAAGPWSRGGAWAILRQALPLGAVLMLASLNTNLPRYAIERFLGLPELGAFAAVVSFVTAGGTIVNALGQAATPRLARHAASSEGQRFRTLALKLAGLAAGLGLAGMLAAYLVGSTVLSLAYRPEYAAYSGLLTGVMGAAIPAYVAGVLGYAVTAARAFDAQVPLFAAVAATCGAVSWVLAPRLGLAGAVVALGIASTVQVGGQLLILRHALGRRREAE